MSVTRAGGVPGPRTWWVRVLGVVIPVAVVLLCEPGPFPWSLAAGLAACAVLPLRYRWPWLAVLACVPALVGGLGWPPAMVGLYAVGRSSGRRLTTLPWAVLCCAAAVAPVFVTQTLRWPDMIMTVIAAGLYSLAPAVLGMLITTQEQLEDSLSDLEAAREATVAAREEVARAAERDRIGREIHDAVGHHATMIAVGAAALAATSHDKQTRETAERLRVLAKRALAEMRAALGLLGTDSELSSGIAALPNLVLRARETGMHVELIGERTLGDDLPLGVERTVYRLVQESLTNAAKHARGADVEVKLERWATELRVTITNGRPPRPRMALPPGHGGGGLAGLAERIGMMGGRLRARPTTKGGFAVQGRLPTPPLDRTADQPAPPPERPLRDTKVATDEATNDGSAAKGARAH
ncbi:sensor histidine kinase [Pseudonocardia acaciae]|uniref:sensor histidine kinase n=1 Tax=Pseudonocardia acaciae TaxID=551276 RepID=UPI000A056F33|nr:histidine kinase [Pseudonocardia acaciae]